MSDYHSFYVAFPKTYLVLFVLLRVLPLSLSVVFVLHAAKTYLFKKDLPRVFEYPSHRVTLAAGLFALGFCLRLFFVLTTDSVTYGTDAAARFMQAKEWYQNPNEIPGGLIWLPMYHLLILLFTPLGLDVALSGRVSILLFSSLSIPLFYGIVNRVFNTRIAFWSAFILAISPFHTLYSSLYLSENLFLFFVLCAFYTLLLYIDKGRKKYLFLSSFFINGATMLRYEGWIIAGLLPLYLFTKRKDLVLSSRYLLFSSVCILLYCWQSLSFRGVLIYGLYVSDMDVRAELSSRSDKWMNIVRNLSSELLFPVWFYLLLIAGAIQALIKRQNLSYAFIWLVLFSFTAYKVLTFTSQPFWRYFAVAAFMLVPYGVRWLSEISKNSKTAFSVAVLLVFALHFPALMQAYSHRQNLSRAPIAYKQACKLLKEIRKPGEKVIATVHIAGMDNASFMEDANVPRNLIYQPMPAWMKMFDNYEEFSDQSLMRKVSDSSYRYIFVQKGLVIDSVLYSEALAEELKMTNIYLDTLFNDRDFQLLQIEKR